MGDATKASPGLGVHGSFRIMVFSWYMPGSRIAGSYGCSIFTLRNLHTVQTEVLLPSWFWEVYALTYIDKILNNKKPDKENWWIACLRLHFLRRLPKSQNILSNLKNVFIARKPTKMRSCFYPCPKSSPSLPSWPCFPFKSLFNKRKARPLSAWVALSWQGLS